ncbi:MAG: LarC family nickel insertion protein [Candidatus Omnitrophota bacterium]
MKTIYFQLAGGAAGDMLLSSLISLGCPVNYLKKEFKKLKIEFDIKTKNSKTGHLSDKKLYFSGKSNLSYREIVKVLRASKLDNDIKDKALKCYELIFNVERKIHKTKGKDFKFHHLGEIDAILEICGFYLALKYLQIENIYVSSFPLGFPCAAVLAILKGKNIRVVDSGYETVTPTAAALLRDAKLFDDDFTFEKSGAGYGDCGESDYLVAYLSEVRSQKTEDRARIEHDKIIKIETNIDDMNPQVFEPLFEVLYKAGAKEVYLEQVIMKKVRPGFVLNVLCAPDDYIKMRDIIFSHTSTFGIRYQEYSRDKLKYEFVSKKTKFGKIKFRVSEGSFKKETPEYEDCRKIANKLNIPLIEVIRLIS